MSIVARVLGYVVLALFVLASTNALKRYTKNRIVRAVASKHRIFGALAAATAVIHLIVNLLNGNTNPLGLLALLLVITTGALGASFKKFKNKKLYVAHRIAGPMTLLVMLLHIFLP